MLSCLIMPYSATPFNVFRMWDDMRVCPRSRMTHLQTTLSARSSAASCSCSRQRTRSPGDPRLGPAVKEWVGITKCIKINLDNKYTLTTKCRGGGLNGYALSRPSDSRSVSPSVPLHYRVCSIYPIPIEGFSSNLAEMFTSTRGCAEPMLPMCQLKVTIEGQISNNKILDTMLCPLCKSYTNWKIFFNLGSNVHLNKGMCRTRVTLLPA